MRIISLLLMGLIFISCNRRAPNGSLPTNQIIPFTSVLNTMVYVRGSIPRATLLLDQADEQEFLNSIGAPNLPLQPFAYNDSALIAVINPQVDPSSSFRIDSLKMLGSAIHLYTTISGPPSRAFHDLSPCQIIAIRKPASRVQVALNQLFKNSPR